MKVTLLMAITINGFIADPHDDTDWVKDLDALKKTITEFGIIVMGKRTYDECMKYHVFPYEGAINIVMTHDNSLLSQSTENTIFSNKSPKEIIQLAEEKGFDSLLIIGGGHINGSFLKEEFIDEIILDVHPMIMAKGIKLFEDEFDYKNLELVSHEEMNDQILQVKYKVKK